MSAIVNLGEKTPERERLTSALDSIGSDKILNFVWEHVESEQTFDLVLFVDLIEDAEVTIMLREEVTSDPEMPEEIRAKLSTRPPSTLKPGASQAAIWVVALFREELSVASMSLYRMTEGGVA